MDTNLKTERTKAGLKIYQRFDEDSEWFHIKTVNRKYLGLFDDIEWIKDFKRIRANKEEISILDKLHGEREIVLAMRSQIKRIKWPNKATKDFVNEQEVSFIRKVEPRNDDPYCVIVMSRGTEVRCDMTLYNMATKRGVKTESIKRLQ